jgi:cell division protein ZapA (FtsZ GTPase activity inhibitor)
VLKFTASALLIVATLGLAACDSKSEQKAQDAQAHQEKSQEKMESAQDKVNGCQRKHRSCQGQGCVQGSRC